MLWSCSQHVALRMPPGAAPGDTHLGSKRDGAVLQRQAGEVRQGTEWGCVGLQLHRACLQLGQAPQVAELGRQAGRAAEAVAGGGGAQLGWRMCYALLQAILLKERCIWLPEQPSP